MRRKIRRRRRRRILRNVAMIAILIGLVCGGVSIAGNRLPELGVFVKNPALLMNEGEYPKAVSYTHLDVYKRQSFLLREITLFK